MERLHRTLMTAITARKQSWLTALPVALLDIRAAVNESEFSPFTALTGAEMLLPLVMIQEEPEHKPLTSDAIKKLSQEVQTQHV